MTFITGVLLTKSGSTWIVDIVALPKNADAEDVVRCFVHNVFKAAGAFGRLYPIPGSKDPQCRLD